MKKEFDQFSQNYKDLLDDSLKVTGFDTNYFATAKIKTLANFFPGLCHRPINFLDYGCGTGLLLNPVQQFFPLAAYAGTDLSNEMIKEARTQTSGSDIFFAMDSKQWKQRTYDLIFASNVFHHIPEEHHQKILQELRKLLTPNGKIIVWEHNPLNPFTRKIVKDCIFDQDAVLISPGKMKRQFRNAGISKLQVTFTTFFPQSLKFLVPLEPWLGWCPLGAQYLLVGENPDNSPPS
ncbi:MAG: class I SAM-dependent methyltransferase [Nitrospinae bacterium]|nr:class I SAM-dependent methyltransferase [Nitrospinota bacterium]MDA1109271.1 class I SAM-dependent methyltransferase [Nitrospinota bacterium]